VAVVHIYTQTVHRIQQYSTHLHSNSTQNTAVQYTFTLKQYTEYRGRNTHNNNVINKEPEKILKHKDLTTEIQRIRNVNAEVIPASNMSKETISKLFRKYLSNILGK
jgi:hypothetical protein